MTERHAKEASSGRPKTDTELVRQLDLASDGKKLVQAVVRLRPDDPSQIVPEAERTEELATQLLERVKQHSGKAASRYNVFRNLGSFVVSAEPTFIRQLMAEPEVASIMANQQPGSALIPPIRKKSGGKAKKKSPSAGKRKQTRASSTSKKSTRKSPK